MYIAQPKITCQYVQLMMLVSRYYEVDIGCRREGYSLKKNFLGSYNFTMFFKNNVIYLGFSSYPLTQLSASFSSELLQQQPRLPLCQLVNPVHVSILHVLLIAKFRDSVENRTCDFQNKKPIQSKLLRIDHSQIAGCSRSEWFSQTELTKIIKIPFYSKFQFYHVVLKTM